MQMLRNVVGLACLAVLCTHAAATDQARLWSTATATRPSDGHVIVYRFISEFVPNFSKSDYPERVTIRWSYESSTGLPSTAERQSMDQFEDLLAPVAEVDSLGSLVLVSTGNNRREWTYYIRSRETFLNKLDFAVRSQKQFPILIDIASDPEWKSYEAFRGGLAK